MKIAGLGILAAALLVTFVESASPTIIAAMACQPAIHFDVAVIDGVEQPPTVVQVTVQADRAQRPTNTLRQIGIASAMNARVETLDHAPTAGESVALSPPREDWSFSVHQVSEGPFFVNLVASDACGDVPTFVGHSGVATVPSTSPRSLV